MLSWLGFNYFSRMAPHDFTTDETNVIIHKFVWRKMKLFPYPLLYHFFHSNGFHCAHLSRIKEVDTRDPKTAIKFLQQKLRSMQ